VSATKPDPTQERKGLYVAEIRRGKVRKHLGYFGSAEEAHNAYLTAARELHGKFCRGQ